MLQYMQRIQRRRDNEDGASAVEYGLLVAAIAAIITQNPRPSQNPRPFGRSLPIGVRRAWPPSVMAGAPTGRRSKTRVYTSNASGMFGSRGMRAAG